MNPEDRILRALESLKHADRDLQAPPAVEANLLAAFQERSRRQVGRKGGSLDRLPWMMMATLAAAAIVLVLLVRLYNSRPESARVIPVAHPVLVEQAKQDPIPDVPSKTLAATPARKRAVSPVHQPPIEMVTDFFPLMDVAPPLGRGQLLRVSVPAGTMVSVGVPVREERWNEPVQADVLIGEEGMVRAIRFVSQRNQ